MYKALSKKILYFGKITTFLSVLLICFILISCNDAATDTDPVKDSYETNLAGSVLLKNSNHKNSEIEDLFGISISIEGTNHKASTDANGNWSMSHVRLSDTRITIVYEKDGFGKYKKNYNISESKITNTISSVSMYSIPLFYADSLAFEFENANVKFSWNITSKDSTVNLYWNNILKNNVLLISSKTFDNDVNTYEKHYDLSPTHSEKKGNESISLSSLYSSGFKPGDKVYATIIMTPFSSTYHYTEDSKKVFTAVSKMSNIVEIVLP